MPTNTEVTNLLYELKEAKYTVTTRATDEHINLIKYMYGKNLLGKSPNGTYTLSDNGQYIIDRRLTYETWKMLSNTKNQWVNYIIKTLVKEEKSQFADLKNHRITEFDRAFEEALVRGIIKRNGNGYDYQLSELGYTIAANFLDYAQWSKKEDRENHTTFNSAITGDLNDSDNTLKLLNAYEIKEVKKKSTAMAIFTALAMVTVFALVIIAGYLVWYLQMHKV